jgi:hypothetical protein
MAVGYPCTSHLAGGATFNVGHGYSIPHPLRFIHKLTIQSTLLLLTANELYMSGLYRAKTGSKKKRQKGPTL